MYIEDVNIVSETWGLNTTDTILSYGYRIMLWYALVKIIVTNTQLQFFKEHLFSDNLLFTCRPR